MLRRCISDGNVNNVSPFAIGTNSVCNGSRFGHRACAKSGSTNKYISFSPLDQQYTPLSYAQTGCFVSVELFAARTTSSCDTCFATRWPFASNALIYGVPAVNLIYW